jgi:uncharacterized protein YbjT (DUF2867 family)
MNQQVLLLGATGQTGHSILNGLLEYGGYVSFGRSLDKIVP